MRRHRSPGFTLVELMVAMALMGIVIIGVLNMLDVSTRISKVEAALADTQENVRFAAYHLMRTARMAGAGEMPFARAGAWLVGEILDDQTGAVSLTNFGTVSVAPQSDVLVLRGFFETPTFFTNRSDVDLSGKTVTIREHRDITDASSDIINHLDQVPLTTGALVGRGIVFMGMRRYQVGQVTGWTATGSAAGGDRVITIGFGPGGGIWPTLNPGGAAMTGTDPDFNVYRVGVLQTYAYWVTPQFTLMRRRATSGGSVDEPVAVNIGSLQVALGLDTNNDGEPDSFLPAPTLAQVTAAEVTSLRITVLGRTPFPVQNWNEPAATFAIQDDDPTITSFDRRAKWRRMDVVAGLRNFGL